MPLFTQNVQSIPSNLLVDKYGWPPFSILNTISFDWQRRKDEWERLGIFTSDGRDVKRYNATPTNTFSARGADAKTAESVSIFDPYLCELMYRWFSIKGMRVLDPFAGGCVRGVVASVLGRYYFGIDLSNTQVETNNAQYHTLTSRYTNISGTTEWIVGDSNDVLDTLQQEEKFDMVFTCPPYYNLEKYSDNPKDLSNLETYGLFLEKYGSILDKSAKLLKEDSFFVIVVSELRANSHDIKESQYVGFVADTINILRNSGLKYYNEIILENNIGSLPIRAPKNFSRRRKIGRHHQNILVFYKGKIENIENKFNADKDL